MLCSTLAKTKLVFSEMFRGHLNYYYCSLPWTFTKMMMVFVACQEAGGRVMEVAWKSVLEDCVGGMSITCPPHGAPLSWSLEQGDSCGADAASGPIGSLVSPWGTVVEWFLYLSKSSLVEQITFSSRIRGHALGSCFLKFIFSFCTELSSTV